MSATNEEERYAQLVAELLSDRGYVDGRRRFPRTVTARDALRISGWIHDQVDRGCADRGRAAAAKGVKIACAPGCSYCCVQPVTVFLPEAIRIAEWLLLPRNAAVREAFLAAYPAWRDAVGDGFAPILDAAARQDVKAQSEAHIEQMKRVVMCAFNREGMCSIYEVRPAMCRNHHAIETNERCKVDRESAEGDSAIGFAFKPVDELMDQAKHLSRALHHALGGERLRPRALCQAVHDVLHTDDERLKAV